MKRWIAKEMYVVIHGQSALFRSVKWLVFVVIGYLLYRRNGWSAVGWYVLIGAVAGVALHFFFRWKTKGWTQCWRGINKIPTPHDKS